MKKTILHIKSETECRVFLFDEEIGIIKQNKHLNIPLTKGEHDLLFIDINNPLYQHKIEYHIVDINYSQKISLKQSYFKKITSKATDEELSNGITDEFGVVYSRDGRELLKCNNISVKQYNIKDGCEIIRDNAFCFNERIDDILDSVYKDETGVSTFEIYDETNKIHSLLKEIFLPEGLSYIGDYAFFGCEELKKVIFPSSIKCIGKCAFAYCGNLTGFSLHKEVKFLGSMCFLSCHSLGSVSLPNSITTIGEGAFESCINLKSIKLPKHIECIPSRCFSCCSELQNIIVPPNVTKIGNDAFQYCNSLTEISLPDVLTHIGDGAFLHCPLQAIELPKELNYIGDCSFMQCPLNTIELPSKVQHIGDYSFAYNDKLLELTIPKDLSYLGNLAFPYSHTLSKIKSDSPCYTIINGCLINESTHELIRCFIDRTDYCTPDYVWKISEKAFANCSQLSNVTLSDNISIIDSYAFANCKNLKTTNIPLSLKKMNVNVFSGTIIETLKLRDNNLDWDEEWITFIDNFLIDNRDGRLLACFSHKKEIVLPEMVRVLDNDFFENFQFESILLPKNIQHIGRNALGNALGSAYHKIIVPSSNKEIILSLMEEYGMYNIFGNVDIEFYNQ